MKTKTRRYASVSEMVRATCEKSFADEFDQLITMRSISKRLCAMRAVRGLSLADCAKRMGCSRSRVARIENATNRSLRLGDLEEYLAAMNG